MSNFKMPKGEFVGQFAQAPWISLHRHNLNFGDRQFRDSGSFYFRISGVSISGFLHGKKKLQHHEVPNVKYRKGHTSHDSVSFYFGILGVSISGFLHGKQKLQHHEVLNAEILKP
jgi:hypothetical protein